MRIAAAYITATSANTAQAEDFVTFLQSNADAQAGLLDSSQRFPAFDADTLSARQDTPAGLATTQALVTLAAYAALAY
jgi:ABC-type thiamine transport system substrate-binding protein